MLLAGFSLLATSERYAKVKMGLAGFAFDTSGLVFTTWLWLYDCGLPYRTIVLVHACVACPAAFAVSFFAYPCRDLKAREGGANGSPTAAETDAASWHKSARSPAFILML